jgi:hypothetical protein
VNATDADGVRRNMSMPAADRMFDFLTGAEADYMQVVIGKLGETA